MSASKDEVKALLQANAEALCRELLPDGRRTGSYWIACNPSRDDRNAGSFFVWTRGAPGAWKDAATGQQGDVFSLIALCEGWDTKHDFANVMDWSRRWLGLDNLPPLERQKRVAKARESVARQEKDRAELEQKNRNRAKAIYLESKRRPFGGSPADRYLRGRGIDISQFSRMPGCLGWLPEERLFETDQRWPVMVACFTADDGSVAAVHRTFLEPDGSGKLSPERRQYFDVGRNEWKQAPARKIWPAFGGSAIRLWRGESNLPVKEAEEQGLLETLVICEGVEDGLSLVMAAPQHRIWCAGSLSNVGELVVPKCCDRVIVCADNDWGKPEALRLLDRGLANLARQGCDVRVARSMVGKDVNDALVSNSLMGASDAHSASAPDFPKAGRFA